MIGYNPAVENELPKIVLNNIQNVCEKSGWLAFVPGANDVALAIHPHIYFPYREFRLLQENPSPGIYALVAHEATHFERQAKMGVKKWWRRYILSPAFRVEEELLAIDASLAVLQVFHEGPPVPKLARNLSSMLYFWAISYDEAYERIWRLAQKYHR